MEAKKSLAPAARAALQQNPIAALRSVEVYEEGGRLILTGRLRSYYLKQLAQEAVLRVVEADVQIQNRIVVEKRPVVERAITVGTVRFSKREIEL